PARNRAIRRFAQRRDKRKLEELKKENQAKLAARAAQNARVSQTAADPLLARRDPTAPRIVAGFYVNWEETSKASLRRNIDELTHFFPEWLHLTRGGSKLISDGRIPEDL